MSAFTASIQYCAGHFTSEIRQGKGEKRLPDWRGKSKTAFIHKIIYIENLMKSRKKLLEQISEFSKLARCNNQLFFYIVTNN